MVLQLFQNYEQKTLFLLSVIFGPVTIIFTLLRFIAAGRLKRKLGWDDWHALLAEVFFLVYVGYTIWLCAVFNGRTIPQVIKADINKFHELLKVGNIMNGLAYGFQQSFAKFSLLALYHRLFWVNNHFTVTVWIVAGLQGAWGIVVFLVHVFACRPIAKVWDATIPGYCIDTNIFFSIYEPINSVLDFVVAGLALWMLPSLQMSRVTIWHLAILFLIGGFSGVIGIIKTVEAQNAASSNFLSIIWNVAQMATSVICCCAPLYQSILPKMGIYNRLYTWATSTFGSGRRSEGNSSGRQASFNNYSTGTNPSDKSGGLNYRSNWVNLDGSSQRGLAWVETDTDRRKEGLHDDETSSIPMGAVRVERSVDVV